MNRIGLKPAGTLFSLALATGPLVAAPMLPPPVDPGARRPIDLAICLDTSNSMDHLIDSARARLWDMVTELSRARPTPHLRVALLTYGSPDVSTAAAGWVVRQTDLTDNLDALYSRLMALRTHGGDEYVGWVLRDAVETLSWSNDPQALKVIFVAGNESADQCSSTVNFRHVAELAKARGIAINAIYCGSEARGRAEGWLEVAVAGGGSYSAIDVVQGTVQIQTPFDRELSELNRQLNETYLPFGAAGEASFRQVRAVDEVTQQVGAQTAGSRVVAKASPLYVQTDWDLVDASRKEGFRLEEIPQKQLPSAMQSMSREDQKAHIERQAVRRAEIQKRILERGEKREEYLRKQAQSPGGQQGLDAALQSTIRSQAEQKGFTFEPSAAP